jgi:hypothetical protein
LGDVIGVSEDILVLILQRAYYLASCQDLDYTRCTATRECVLFYGYDQRQDCVHFHGAQVCGTLHKHRPAFSTAPHIVPV